METHSLVHDDTDGVVQQALSEDDRVQLGVNFVLIEDGEDGDRVGGGQRRTEDEAFYEGDFQLFQTEERVDVDEDTALETYLACHVMIY